MEYHRFWNMGKIFLDTLSIENAPWPELRSYCPETFLYASPSFTSAHQQAASVRTQQFCFKLSHDEFFFWAGGACWRGWPDSRHAMRVLPPCHRYQLPSVVRSEIAVFTHAWLSTFQSIQMQSGCPWNWGHKGG